MRTKFQKFQQFQSLFNEVEKVSGLCLKKVHLLENSPIFAIFGRPVIASLPAPKSLPASLESSNDPMTKELKILSYLVDNLDELLKIEDEINKDIDLDPEVRYQMKELCVSIFGVSDTDSLRLVQAGCHIYIFRLDQITNFHKTNKGYAWNWVK